MAAAAIAAVKIEFEFCSAVRAGNSVLAEHILVKIYGIVAGGALYFIKLLVIVTAVAVIIAAITIVIAVNNVFNIGKIRVNRVKRLVYSLSGLMAAISGIAMAARLGVGQSTAGQSYEMDAIAATVIGGASLSGGSGSIVGAIIGAAIMGVLRNGLVLLDVSAYWQQTVIGAVIILAVALDNLRHMKKKA